MTLRGNEKIMYRCAYLENDEFMKFELIELLVLSFELIFLF